MSFNSVVLSLKNHHILKDKKLIYAFISILSGLIMGVIAYVVADDSEIMDLFQLFTELNTDFTDKSKMEIIFGIVLSGLPYYVVMFVIGGSIFGKVLSLTFTAIKSMGISIIASLLYCNMGLKGLEYAILIFFPGKTVFIFSLLLAAVTTIDMSNLISECNKSELHVNIKKYIIKFLVILLLMGLSWLIDYVCYCIFSDLF